MDERRANLVERSGHLILIAAVVCGILGNGAARTQEFLVVQGLVMAATVGWVTRLVLDGRGQLLWPPVTWAVVAFAAYAVWLTARAPLGYPAGFELARVVVYLLVFLLACNHLARQEQATGLVYVLAAAGSLVAAYAVYQFATKSDQVLWLTRPESYAGRGSGTFICPNSLAGFLAIVLPLVTSLALGGQTPIVGRICLAYAGLMMLAGLAVSLSRGGWAAAGCGMFTLILLHLWFRQHTRRALVLLLVLVVLAGGVASRSLVIQLRVRGTVERYHVGDPVELRLSLWRSAWQMWQDHFWLGVGPGQFDYRFPAYRETSVQARPVHAHNDYLNTLADWGVVGAAIILVAVGTTGFMGLRGLRLLRRRQTDLAPQRSSDRWSVVAGSMAGLVAVLAHSLVDFDMQLPGIAILVVVLLALINSHSRQRSEPPWLRLPALARVVLGLALLAIVGWLALFGVKAGREAGHLSRALAERYQTPERREELKAALRLRPDNFSARFALAESYRQVSWQGDRGYETNATEAIAHYRAASETNPFDPYNPISIGLCLDWLGQHAEAFPYYERALELDPNNYYLSILRGWHHLQTGEYAVARRWFARSLQQKHWPNPQAARFLSRTDRLIREAKAADSSPKRPPGQ